MAIADSVEAIGAATELLQSRLEDATKVSVDVGRPEAAAAGSGRKLNLFLYKVAFDPHLKNHPLDEGQEPPLWVVLHYLLTAFDSKESDSALAHRLLSRGLAALQSLNFLRPAANDLALSRNPDALKLTFDDADVELLSKIMQGTDEKYRVSAAFQLRPVMIMPDSLPDYAPPVKTVGPQNRGPEIIPSLGARLESVEPTSFEVGATLTISGKDLAGYDRVKLGPSELPAAPGGDGGVQVVVPVATTLSPGAYSLAVTRTLASGHPFTSNALLAHLRPKVTAVSHGPLTAASGGPPKPLFGSLKITGSRLGGPSDAIFVAFYREGVVRLMLEVTGTDPQKTLTASVIKAQALPPGKYAILLRVNGEQAVDAPFVNWA
jgi:hypothetical protein